MSLDRPTGIISRLGWQVLADQKLIRNNNEKLTSAEEWRPAREPLTANKVLYNDCERDSESWKTVFEDEAHGYTPPPQPPHQFVLNSKEYVGVQTKYLEGDAGNIQEIATLSGKTREMEQAGTVAQQAGNLTLYNCGTSSEDR